MRVWETDEVPGLASADGFVDSVAADDVAANASFARAYVDDVRIGFRDGDGTYGGRCGLFFVEDRRPVHAAIHRLPDATGHCAEIICVVLPDDPGDCEDASATEW